MIDNEPINFNLLSEKVHKLLETLSKLQQTNEELTGQLGKYTDGDSEQKYLQRVSDLEEEIRQLKKENKILKERERIIKNKVERLAVKLEKIEL